LPTQFIRGGPTPTFTNSPSPESFAGVAIHEQTTLAITHKVTPSIREKHSCRGADRFVTVLRAIESVPRGICLSAREGFTIIAAPVVKARLSASGSTTTSIEVADSAYRDTKSGADVVYQWFRTILVNIEQ
jgi:hypothetical protein